MLGKVRVAADDSVDYLGFTVPCCVKRSTGANGAFPELRSDMSHFLAADLGEELVNIVYYTITHVLFLLSEPYLALRQLKPISLVAPVITCSSASMLPSGLREPA